MQERTIYVIPRLPDNNMPPGDGSADNPLGSIQEAVNLIELGVGDDILTVLVPHDARDQPLAGAVAAAAARAGTALRVARPYSMSIDPIDWKKVLRVYINHVGECEGVTFLSNRHNHHGCLGHLSPEELTALRGIEDEPPLERKPVQ